MLTVKVHPVNCVRLMELADPLYELVVYGQQNPFINWKKATDKMKAHSYQSKSNSFGTPANTAKGINYSTPSKHDIPTEIVEQEANKMLLLISWKVCEGCQSQSRSNSHCSWWYSWEYRSTWLSKVLTNGNTVAAVYMLDYILPQVAKLSRRLQTDQLDLLIISISCSRSSNSWSTQLANGKTESSSMWTVALTTLEGSRKDHCYLSRHHNLPRTSNKEIYLTP